MTLQSFTEMSSHQIDALADSARLVWVNLDGINGGSSKIMRPGLKLLKNPLDFDNSMLLMVFDACNLKLQPAPSSTASASRMAESRVATPSSELIDRKRDLISEAFDNLKTKYDERSNWPCFSSILPLDRATWQAGINQLESNLLPSLRSQLLDLKRKLQRSDLRRNEGTRLDQISHLQSELDQTLHQIVSFAAIVRRRTLFSPADTDDRHSEELKAFRFQGLQSRVKDLTGTLSNLFANSSGVVRSLKLSPHEYVRPTHQLNHRRVIYGTNQAFDMINRTIKWLQGHEFCNIREDWDRFVPDLNSVLRKLTMISASIDDVVDNDYLTRDLSQPEIQVAQSAIPVTKLSRLFFTKLLRSGITKTPLQSFTEMSSHEIQTLTDSAGLTWNNLSDIRQFLLHGPTEGETFDIIIESMNQVLLEFDNYMILVVFYILPLIPSQVNCSSSETSLATWLVNWKHLFLIATKDFISAAKLL
ncbi:hypothetical protein H4Q26_015451 [Puccinia striiformis f. sp. tritici PST-130]|nr:hypothetical protein H4Q26_015451 [Puccinia striiformis f. sp. tritici PST-130]